MPFSTISADDLGGLGGTCVLRGCVPKKLLVYASKFSHEFEESHGFGWAYDTDPKHDWSTLIANKNTELQRLVGIYKNILKNANVDLIEGRGKVVDPHTVSVDGKLYTAKNILIAVGGRPSMPDIPGIEHVIDSDAALDLPSKPEKIAIVGGGYIALEFAGIFNGLKSDVHVFIRQPKVLRGFDEEVRDFVAEQMSLRGITFHTEHSPQAITKSNDGLLSLKTNKETIGGFSHVMFATGRKPNTKVDEYSRTSVDSIWAVGDVTDRINLTPVALMEGGAFAKTLFGDEPTKPEYRAVPAAVFSQPPIGQVGLTEEQAIEEYGDVDVYLSNFRPLRATLSGLPDRVLMKLIVCATTNKVVGVHMCGDDAPEIIQGIAIGVKAGLTKQDFDVTVGVHPTSAEEFVTMRSPTRKVRRKTAAEGIAIGVKAGLTKQDFDVTVGVHPTSAEEFVTMRSPTRKVRRKTAAEFVGAVILEDAIGRNLTGNTQLKSAPLPEKSVTMNPLKMYDNDEFLPLFFAPPICAFLSFLLEA
uniref:glutathione-disulfide reductase n=1 Tax=Aegilops tauschii TaxID=37682 RepID=R7W1N9_AEGTA